MMQEMDPQHYPGLRKWVVGCLSAHKKPNDIIYNLCQQTGWDWKQSQRFVEVVAEEGRKEIHQKRAPLLVGIGLFFVVSGGLLLWSTIPELAEILSQFQPPLDMGKIIEYVLMARSGVILIARLVTGIGMIVGGGYGTIEAISSAMTGEGEVEVVKK